MYFKVLVQTFLSTWLLPEVIASPTANRETASLNVRKHYRRHWKEEEEKKEKKMIIIGSWLKNDPRPKMVANIDQNVSQILNIE